MSCADGAGQPRLGQECLAGPLAVLGRRHQDEHPVRPLVTWSSLPPLATASGRHRPPSYCGTPVMIPRNPRAARRPRRPCSVIRQLPERPLVLAGPLLEHAHGLADLALRLEVAEQQDRVGQVAHVDVASPSPPTIRPCWATTMMVTTPFWLR